MNQLGKRLAKGERTAFVELYDWLGESIFRYVATRIGRNEATDVIQDVFVRMIRFHRQFRSVDDVKAYTFRMVHNEIVRWLQSNAARTVNGEVVQRAIPPNDDADQSDWISHMLSALDERDQDIVRLKICSDLTFLEIATVLEMPPSTVATRYRRAIQRLKTSIDRERVKSGEPKENEDRS